MNFLLGIFAWHLCLASLLGIFAWHLCLASLLGIFALNCNMRLACPVTSKHSGKRVPTGSKLELGPVFGPICVIEAKLQTDKHPFGCYLMTTDLIYDTVKIERGG